MNDNYVDVLQQYEGEAAEIRRGRGAWICSYPEGIRLLKEYRGSVKRLEFEETVLDALRRQGIRLVDQYVRNREGGLLTAAPDGTKYILKEWYADRECAMSDSREILEAAGWIARLHRAYRTIEWQEEWNLGSMLPPGLGAEMGRHNRELKRVRTYISGKRKKSEFELCVMQHFSAFYEQALQAQQGLEALGMDGEQECLFLCHGDLDQHHILLRGREAVFIEFNQMHRGCQMTDLYHFMRKAMEKHNWNEHLGLAMMERYDQVLSIGEDEQKYLYYLFLYPEKYWKQLNYYYNANKAWVPARSVEKLKKLEEQQEEKLRFLSKIKLR